VEKGKGLSYRDAGVDIDAGNRLVDDIRAEVATTHRSEVIGGIGGFGGLFRVPTERYADPVLVSGTDGVGTKLRLAIESGSVRGVGIDLVAMCVNDIAVLGAEPLFFLDYYATGKLDNVAAAAVIAGIAEGCRLSGAALLGGETAEMPGMYAPGDFDLAGFAVGIVDRGAIIDGAGIQPNDVVLGLASSGAHSNGYSLIRKIVERSGQPLDASFDEATLGETLLAPTRIYVPAVRAAVAAAEIRGIAHITGGGLVENLARALPEGLGADIDRQRWPRPPIFDWLQAEGDIADAEMWRTFNCGIGMTLVVPAQGADAAVRALEDAGETVWPIGRVVSRTQSPLVRIA